MPTIEFGFTGAQFALICAMLSVQSFMQTAMLLWIVGAVVVVGIVSLFAFSRQQRRPRDLGSVSRAWTTEHNATTHGRDSS
jgi:predicted deacylase